MCAWDIIVFFILEAPSHCIVSAYINFDSLCPLSLISIRLQPFSSRGSHALLPLRSSFPFSTLSHDTLLLWGGESEISARATWKLFQSMTTEWGLQSPLESIHA